jgi:NTP pyrophosphatase (non-canonical NTP hydrolase)
MDLSKIIELQMEFDKRHTADEPFFIPITASNPRDLEHLVVCMLGELGEFSNVLKKVVRGDITYEQAEPQLHEELTDVFIYLIKVAGQSGIDLEARYLEKLNKNESRFAHWRNP